jgi:hypothetical protein
MSVTRQTAQIRRQHRLDHADTAERPPDLSAGPLSDLESLRIGVFDALVSAHIDHNGRAVAAAGEEVRCVPTPTRPTWPVQPERLRGEPHDLTVEVQQHRVITLKPGLVTDVPATGRRPPPAREVLLSLGPTETSHRLGILERHVPTHRQRTPTPRSTCSDEVQLEAGTTPIERGFRHHRHHPRSHRPRHRTNMDGRN